MKKVFHFDTPREQYLADAAVLWCFDNRFELGCSTFLKNIGVVVSDPIKVAGGAKCLSSPNNVSEREFVLDQIRTSMRLHGTKRVLLIVHSDCGAYGGLAQGFNGDAKAEAAHHKQELHRAAAKLAEAIPGLQIEGYFVDFEGIWDAQVNHDSSEKKLPSPDQAIA
jgi:carbonic anhydrase